MTFILQNEIHYIDTHCHIEQSEFDIDRDEVISKAEANGIIIISSAISKDYWDKLLNITNKHSSIFPSIGLDPLLSHDCELAIQHVRENKSTIVALGEVGLDHYREREHEGREQQEETFKKMISLSMELKLPIQVHSRSAGKVALDVLETQDAENVHMHAFDGKASLARRASYELGYYFSIPTSVVRSPQKQKLVKAIEIEHLLLETDSPVLAPVGGERNVPSNITIALSEVARILRRGEEELREIILENTLRLYSKIR